MWKFQAVKYTGLVPTNMTKREFNAKILQPAYQKLGEWFWAERLPLRFTEQGARMLQYTPRSGEQSGLTRKQWHSSYTARKLRKFGHKKPLVFTGESQRITQRIRDVRATSKGVRIVLHANRLNFMNPKSKVRPSEEIRRIAAEEYPLIQKQLEQFVQELIDSYSNSETVAL